MQNWLQEDRIVAAVVILATAGYWTDVEHLDTLRSDDIVGPAGFPAAIAILMFAMAAKLLIWPETRDDWVKIAENTWLKWGLLVGYTLAMPVFGFPASTVVFLFSLLMLLGVAWYRAILVSGAGTAAVYAVFGLLLNLRLPIGPWG